MKLIIAEKPSLGKAIAEWLGAQHKHRTHIECKNGYTVTWLFGHLLELYDAHEYDPAWKSWSSPLPIHPPVFKLKLRDDEGIRIQYTAIAGLLKQCNEVINAGDPDREGQLLVDELLEYANNVIPVNRLWLAAIDDKSIAKAFSEIKPNNNYHGYKLAAETRQRADWLIGINYTRAFTKTFQQHGYDNVITIGRVQTPTLKLIVDRDNEIKNFKAKDFYVLEAIFNNETPEVKAKFIVPTHIKELMDDDGRLLNRTCLDDIAQQINNKNAVVANYTKLSKIKNQPLLYSLSELQTVANKKYGFSAQQVLDVAQLLYENKLTSYPRTDCQYLPESQFSDAQDILNKLQNITTYKHLKPTSSIKSKVWNDKKVSAHHAIVPTGANLDNLDNILCGLGKNQELANKIFDLICLQYFAQFYPEFKFDEIEIVFEVGEYTSNTTTHPYQFNAIGKAITDNGWKSLFLSKKTTNDSDDENDEDDKDSSQLLPVLTIGQITTCIKQIVLSKKTTKPSAYTEGTLIQTMSNLHNKIPELVKQLGHDEQTTEKLIKQYQTILKETAGLGTEATRANIIETLKNRVLIKTKGKTLVSTELGQSVINSMISDSVREQLLFLSSPLTTAEYEQCLDEIVGSNNNNHQQQVITKFWDKFTPQLNKIKDFASLELNIPIHANSHKCPNCTITGVISVLKALTGQYGKYWKCSICNSNYKDLNNQPVLTEMSKASAKITGDKCPECSRDLVERDGKFGKFITCSGYPECKWTPPKVEKSAPVKTDDICIKCGNGMVIRESKATNNKFLACSAFPKCKHIMSL